MTEFWCKVEKDLPYTEELWSEFLTVFSVLKDLMAALAELEGGPKEEEEEPEKKEEEKEEEIEEYEEPKTPG